MLTHLCTDCGVHTLSVLGIFLTKVRSHSPTYTTEGGHALATFAEEGEDEDQEGRQQRHARDTFSVVPILTYGRL